MRFHRIRYTIGQLMIAVAVIAVLLAWLDVRAAFALVGLGRVVIIPAAIAPPGRRLEAASWAAAAAAAAGPAGPARPNRAAAAVPVRDLGYGLVCAGSLPATLARRPEIHQSRVEVPYVMFAFSCFLVF